MKNAMFAGVLLCAMVSQVSAAGQSHAEKNCSNADLRGVYSFVASGTFGADPFATAGRTTYDGNGNLEGVIQVSINGVVTPRLNWTGTYMEAVWGYRNPTASNVVDVVVKSLRRKLGDDAVTLETVRGTGYRYRTRASTPASTRI